MVFWLFVGMMVQVFLEKNLLNEAIECGKLFHVGMFMSYSTSDQPLLRRSEVDSTSP